MKIAWAFLIVLYPVFSIYSSPIPSMDLGTSLIVIFGIVSMIQTKKINFGRIQTKFFSLFMMYIIVQFFVLWYFGDIIGIAPVMRILRFTLIISFSLYIGFPYYFDQKVYLKILKRITQLGILYLFAQNIAFYLFGLRLPSQISSLLKNSPSTEILLNRMYRPHSFFSEPSHVAYFCVPLLVISTYRYINLREKSSLYDVVFVVLGILLSTSGQGLTILFVFGLTIILAVFSKKVTKKGLIKFVSSVTVIFLLFILLSSTSLFKGTLQRIFPTDEKEMSAIDARSGGYDAVAELKIVDLTFGKGYGNIQDERYFSGISELVYSTGMIGFTLFSVTLLLCYIMGSSASRKVTVLYFTLMIGGGVFTTTYILYYAPILFNMINLNKEEIT